MKAIALEDMHCECCAGISNSDWLTIVMALGFTIEMHKEDPSDTVIEQQLLTRLESLLQTRIEAEDDSNT